MQYRKFGSTDWKASALGFGAMRLPRKALEGSNEVDIEESIRLIRRGIDAGINYIDTAYAYGESEEIVGQALEGGYRARVRLATKMPCWLIKEYADFDRFLDEELARLRTDRVDYYLLHAVWKERWASMQAMRALEWADKAKADGRIGSLGFSFHDDAGLFREVIGAYDWEMCQIQYNFMNEDVQAGRAGLELAASKGIAVVIMEPLLGGLLANPPPAIRSIWAEAGMDPVDIALQWLWDQEGVSTVLSGMSNMEQLEGNLRSADRSGIGALGQKEKALIERVKTAYSSMNAIPCTKCSYCMPCPQGVNIPRNLELYNQGVIYGDMNLSRALYSYHFPRAEWAAQCIDCKLCEEKCPQKIPISSWMPKIHEALEIRQG